MSSITKYSENDYKNICDKIKNKINCKDPEEVLYYVSLVNYIKDLKEKIKKKYKNVDVITLHHAENNLENILTDDLNYYIIDERDIKKSFLLKKNI